LKPNVHSGEGSSDRAAPSTTLSDFPESARVLLDAMPDAVLVVDDDGRIVLSNAEAEALFRYEPGSMLGMEVESLVPLGLRQRHEELREHYHHQPLRRSMGTCGQRLTGITSHGSVFPTEINLSPCQYGGATYVVAAVRDISDRVQLDRDHRRVLASLDSLPSLVVVIDPDNLWIGYANDGARRMSGYPVDELTSMTPLTLLPGMSRAEFSALVARARTDGQATAETDLQHSDGRRLPLEIWATFVDGVPGGDAAVCVLFGRDVSDRRQAQDQHRAVLDKLRRVAVSAGISIWTLDREGTVVFAQGAELSHLGRLGDAVGRGIAELFESFPTVVAAFDEALGGVDTSTVVSVGGESRQISFQPVIGDGSEVVEVIGTAVDVGELEASRQAAAWERDRLDATHRSMSQGMLTVSIEGTVLEANPAFCGLVGLSHTEVLNSRRPFSFLSEREGNSEFEATWMILAEVGHVEFSTELVRPDGSRIPVLVTADRIAGHPDQALVLFSDLSIRRRFENDLDTANAVLVAADERERIARDLHDRVIQRIFATGISLQSTQSRTADARIAARLGQAVDELDLVIRELRTSVFELHQTPSGGASGVRRDVLAVIDEATRVLGFRPDVRFEGVIEDLDIEVEVDLLAVVRESLTNVARHAAATAASVAVTVDDESLELVVDDNGVGSKPATASTGHGMSNMAGRAERRGGNLVMSPNGPGAGSTLRWWVPLPSDQPESGR
jgi:PAS domain S-box-containing protein